MRKIDAGLLFVFKA